jgi:hypothetical protein
MLVLQAQEQVDLAAQAGDHPGPRTRFNPPFGCLFVWFWSFHNSICLSQPCLLLAQWSIALNVVQNSKNALKPSTCVCMPAEVGIYQARLLFSILRRPLGKRALVFGSTHLCVLVLVSPFLLEASTGGPLPTPIWA